MLIDSWPGCGRPGMRARKGPCLGAARPPGASSRPPGSPRPPIGVAGHDAKCAFRWPSKSSPWSRRGPEGEIDPMRREG